MELTPRIAARLAPPIGSGAARPRAACMQQNPTDRGRALLLASDGGPQKPWPRPSQRLYPSPPLPTPHEWPPALPCEGPCLRPLQRCGAPRPPRPRVGARCTRLRSPAHPARSLCAQSFLPPSLLPLAHSPAGSTAVGTAAAASPPGRGFAPLSIAPAAWDPSIRTANKLDCTAAAPPRARAPPGALPPIVRASCQPSRPRAPHLFTAPRASLPPPPPPPPPPLPPLQQHTAQRTRAPFLLCHTLTPSPPSSEGSRGFEERFPSAAPPACQGAASCMPFGRLNPELTGQGLQATRRAKARAHGAPADPLHATRGPVEGAPLACPSRPPLSTAAAPMPLLWPLGSFNTPPVLGEE
ncbi:hypothetical protein Rsub_07390 [Raphidocelis subcapitata]|uniref:Uncharacterized protein n=1 Tax=Raphidocelis subcapitata TaxID=307507 RepID=A0A2V0P461_9CHLO|nr:hypothetical protein Rsub_07390 [Raphidocelis subcapitata]|eukprot:GBF94654.1 hypothetical protein Rsub_07390 [Raphidocelis subcapitata]